MTDSFDAARVGRAIGAALFVATLLNGLGPFAKRVGLVEREAFEKYWAHRCGPQGFVPMWRDLGRRCAVPETAGFVESYRRNAPYSVYMLAVGPSEMPLKLAKDVVLGGILAWGAILSLKRAGPMTRPRGPILLLWAFLGVATIAAVESVWGGAGRLVLAGARSLAFALIALAWAPSATFAVLEGLAAWCPALLLSQCVVVPWEMLYPSGLATSWLPTRAAGTLVHPNTLGAFAVIVLAFGLSFGASRAIACLEWTLALLLVAASGSGSGWVVLVLLALIELISRTRVSPLVGATSVVALLLLSIPVLPSLTGRSDVIDSVTEGRLSAFRTILATDGLSLALGEGLGTGTNTAITQGRQGLSADSTVTLLAKETGLVGMLLFYAALVVAAHRCQPARLALAGLVLTSLTLNVIEVFPLNALLGLTLPFSLEPR